MKKILNIAAGKFKPLGFPPKDPYILVNLDTMYYQIDEPGYIEKKFSTWTGQSPKTFHCNIDAFQFMERTRLSFDTVCIYRFLEHVSFTNLMYFIYLISTVTEKGSIVDVIVPNYEILSTMILNEDCKRPEFEADNILLTTELLNEPSCPHASIWTPDRAYHFWEMEERFKIKDLIRNFTFDGRDIYLRFSAERI